jgi:crotonobetainyl-CoA:carnitine CoA-transferase CaiB-like acyl-CoA transferase
MIADGGILTGIRVLDFGRYIAGPYVGALLADFGADVIRIEKRDGSEDRYLLPVASNGDGALFLQMNRNKRSMTLDPMHERGREIVRRLVARADVVVANLPPETLVAMGLDYESLRAIKPDVILAAVSAYGTTGPYAQRVGFDGVGQVMSGSAYMTGTEEQPYRCMTNYVDFGTALAGAYGTALALLDRARTGRGRMVDVSLLRTALNFNNAMLIEQAALSIDRKPTGNRAQSSGPADLFRTRDGWILIQVVGNPLFRRIARLIGAAEWLDDPRFASDDGRGRHGEVVSARVAAWCAERRSADALAALDAARIPCGPLYTPREVLEDPHVLAAGLLPAIAADVPGGARVADRIARLSDEPQPAFVRAPLLGEHTDAILTELGYGEAEIAAFEASGAI